MRNFLLYVSSAFLLIPFVRVIFVFNLIFVSLSHIQPVPLVLPCTFGLAVVALTNNMVFHIYRNIRFGFYRDNTITTTMLHRAVDPSLASRRPDGVISIINPATVDLSSTGESSTTDQRVDAEKAATEEPAGSLSVSPGDSNV